LLNIRFFFFNQGISLVSNTLLQNAIFELEVLDWFTKIMETTEHIDIKVEYRFFFLTIKLN